MSWKFGNIEVFPHDMNFDFMKWKTYTVGLSVVATVIALLVIAIHGLNYSIDFLGGAELQVSLPAHASREQIVEIAEKAGIEHFELTKSGNPLASPVNDTVSKATYLMQIPKVQGSDENGTNAQVDHLVSDFKKEWGSDNVSVVSVTNISGKIGKEEEWKGYMALALSFGIILIYISIRFDSRFAPGAVLCLIHDVIMALGFMTATNRPFTISSVAAFLTIVGYSINDTVIVYDRIRETQLHHPRMPLDQVVNRSINQTLNRTVLTAATGLLALLVIAYTGVGTLEDFALTMFVGILVGTYSSIYVAAPLTLMMDGVLRKVGWNPKSPADKVIVQKDPNFIPPVIVRRKDKK